MYGDKTVLKAATDANMTCSLYSILQWYCSHNSALGVEFVTTTHSSSSV